MLRTCHPKLRPVLEKVESGERLGFDEGLVLYDPEVPLNEVGQLADLVRQRLHGNLAYYNLNTHLNPTNICVYRCAFCAFRADLRDTKGYTMSDAQVLERGREAVETGCTEIHIVGGMHHQKGYDWYLHLLRLLHEACPGLHLKAWTAVEIDWFQFLAKKTTREVLTDLIAAGLGSLTGGGAEIFHPEIRHRICEHKADATRWLDIHRTAHRLGLRTNCTMLYGVGERAFHRIDHLIRLRELQDQTRGFQTFVPLAFHPKNTRLADLPQPSSLTDLRNVAVSRLMLDNIDHIKAYWVMLGLGTAQLALAYGADDLDGTVRHESICHDAGGTSPEILSVEQIQQQIREAGCEPVERDTLYRRVVRDPDQPREWRVAETVSAATAS